VDFAAYDEIVERVLRLADSIAEMVKKRGLYGYVPLLLNSDLILQ
jgi:hypothetical protein